MKYANPKRYLNTCAIVVALVLSANCPEQVFAQSSADETFRLLTFEVANSGPRLGVTRGSGDQDIVDVHNAITYLYRSGAGQAVGEERHR